MSDDGSEEIPSPWLPPGRELELPERGLTFVRELPGPSPQAPVVLLLHGWTATADLNWFTSYAALATRFRVLALDHHGHGGGLRSTRRFSLEACADDAIALCDVLGVEQAIVAGYSMGGPVAMLTWRRHRERVAGLVLAATAPYFSGSRHERLNFRGLAGLATLSRATPPRARSWLTEQLYLQRKADKGEPWARREVSRHDWRTILEAGASLGGFSAVDWLGEIDVPTSVIVTMRDEIVPVRRQVKLFELIPDAAVTRIDGGHDAVVARADAFVPALVEAAGSVISRVVGGDRADRRTPRAS